MVFARELDSVEAAKIADEGAGAGAWLGSGRGVDTGERVRKNDADERDVDERDIDERDIDEKVEMQMKGWGRMSRTKET